MAIEDFEAEQALDTLARAEEIRQDHAMMSAINVVAMKKVELAKKLTGSGEERSPHPDRVRKDRVEF